MTRQLAAAKGDTAVPASVCVTTAIPLARVCDLLSTALEDPHSWATWVGSAAPDGRSLRDFKANGRLRPSWAPDYASAEMLMPLIDGGRITIGDLEDGQASYTIDLAAITRGLQVMADLKAGAGGHHFLNFISGEEDAETGYVFLQCCAFPNEVAKDGLRYG